MGMCVHSVIVHSKKYFMYNKSFDALINESKTAVDNIEKYFLIFFFIIYYYKHILYYQDNCNIYALICTNKILLL